MEEWSCLPTASAVSASVFWLSKICRRSPNAISGWSPDWISRSSSSYRLFMRSLWALRRWRLAWWDSREAWLCCKASSLRKTITFGVLFSPVLDNRNYHGDNISSSANHNRVAFTNIESIDLRRVMQSGIWYRHPADKNWLTRACQAHFNALITDARQIDTDYFLTCNCKSLRILPVSMWSKQFVRLWSRPAWRQTRMRQTRKTVIEPRKSLVTGSRARVILIAACSRSKSTHSGRSSR